MSSMADDPPASVGDHPQLLGITVFHLEPFFLMYHCELR